MQKKGVVELAVMFSSPTMIMLFIFGVIVSIVFIGAIITAIVQTSRGRLKVNYDEMAEKVDREEEQKRRQKRDKVN